MKLLKIVKNAYSCFALSLVILGSVFLFCPKITLGLICKITGIVLLIGGIIRVLSYFTKEMFQLAFQFDLGLGIVSMIVGLILLFHTQNLGQVVFTFLGILILIDGTLKIQTAIDAKRFGIEKWRIILIISLIITSVGILLITMPWKTTEFVIRLIGINLALDGFLNLWVVLNTVKVIRRNEV